MARLEKILSTNVPGLRTQVDIYRQDDSLVVDVTDSEKTVKAKVGRGLSASIVVRELKLHEREEDFLRSYLIEISHYPLLKKEQEIELSRKVRKGDKNALDTLVTSNLRLVVKFAKELKKKFYRLDIFELIQEGNIGLYEAAQNYNEIHGSKFSTYSVYWLRQRMMRYVYKQQPVPVHVYSKWKLLKKVESELIAKNKGALPAKREMLKKIRGRLSVRDLDFYLARKDRKIVPYPDGDSFEPGISTDIESISYTAVDVERAMKVLTPRENRFVRMYYGLRPYDRVYNNVKLAEIYGVSRQRVNQIIHSAKKKLRYVLTGKEKKY